MEKQTFTKVTDFLALDEAQFDRMLADLKKWHELTRAMLQMADFVNAQIKENNPDIDIEDGMKITCEGFTWVDDGKNDVLSIQMHTHVVRDGGTVVEKKKINISVEDNGSYIQHFDPSC